MKTKPNLEFEEFTRTVEQILSVPKSEILRREKEYCKKAALNPRKRGPKPKRASSSRVPRA